MGTTFVAKAFIEALLAEVASTVSALTGHATTTTDGTPIAGPAWIVTLGIAGNAKGTVSLTLDADGTETLARAVLGPEAEVTPATVAGLIRELVTQTAGTLNSQPAFVGSTVAVEGVDQGTSKADGVSAHTLVFGGDGRLALTAAATIAPANPTQRAAGAASTGLSTAMSAPVSEKGLKPSGQPGNWDAVLDIDLPLRVRFGVTEMSIRALSALGPGSIVDMGRGPDDPVEIVVCGRVIARAEVVVVDGNYGVRVTDLVSASERVKALEGQW